MSLSQIATSVGDRKKGELPSQPVSNPNRQQNQLSKGQYNIDSNKNPTHEVQAILTLRSGRQVDNKVNYPEENNRVEP